MAVPGADLTVELRRDALLASVGQLRERGRLRRMLYSLELWLPVGFLVVLVLACFVWPEVYGIPNPVRGNLDLLNLPPLSPHHLFGTDNLGNDVFSRILYGGRVSLEVGFGATAIGMAVGGVIGMFAGYRGGVQEAVVMRVLEILLAFPALVLAIIVSTYLGPSELHVIWAISFFSIPAFRAARSRLHASGPRVHLYRRGAAVWQLRRTHPLSPHRPERLPSAHDLRTAGRRHRDHRRGRAQFSWPWRSATWAELGQHDCRQSTEPDDRS